MAFEPIGIPLIVLSGFWFLVGGVAPFFVKGDNREYAYLHKTQFFK